MATEPIEARQPENDVPVTVDTAAARQTGRQWPASLDQPENTPERATPEHGEAQSCAPRHPPRHIEILVDGKRIHSFIATECHTSEDHETLTLEATRWSPTGLMNWPPNPLIPNITGAVVDGEIRIRTGTPFGKSPYPGDPDPDAGAVERAVNRINSLIQNFEGVVQRGTCPECLAGTHICAKDACYCENPHRCGWPTVQTPTPEGNH